MNTSASMVKQDKKIDYKYKNLNSFIILFFQLMHINISKLNLELNSLYFAKITFKTGYNSYKTYIILIL